MSKTVIYEWQSNSQFLIRDVVPDFILLQANSRDGVEDVIRAIPPDSDRFIFHLNCTVTQHFPRKRGELIRAIQERGLAVLNSRTTDISKRHIQRMCTELRLPTTLARREGDRDELIMVKTNLNFAGKTEWALTTDERAELKVGDGSQMIWDPYHYFVVPRKDIQAQWWDDDNLICERFVSNNRNLWYRAYLMGNCVFLLEMTNPHDVKKVDESRIVNTWAVRLGDIDFAQAEELNDVSALLRNLQVFAGGFELDFGTIDIVRDDVAGFFIIDVNTTPAYNNPVPGLVSHLQVGFSEGF